MSGAWYVSHGGTEAVQLMSGWLCGGCARLCAVLDVPGCCYVLLQDSYATTFQAEARTQNRQQ